MIVVELEEESPFILEENQDTTEIVTAINYEHKRKISWEHDPFTHNYKIQSKGYVGYIPINDKYSIHIRPKVDVNNIFRMLEYAYKLKSFELLEGCVTVASVEDIFERLAMVLSRKVLDRNREGLYRGYVQRTQPLTHIRGKIQIKPSMLSMLRGSVRPICRYEENTTDLAENEILLWTLYKLHRFEIKRNDVKRAVRMAYRELVNKVSLIQFNPQDCVNRFYNKLNLDYKPMHGICRFFLEHAGPGIEQGSYNFLPFVLNMPILFQSFVAEWLKEKLPSKYHVTPQYHAKLGLEGNLEFRIDLVLTGPNSEDTLCVLDTKYERTPATKTQDIGQVIAYATKMKTKSAFLVYPSKTAEPFDFMIGSIRAKSLIFDISQDPEKAGLSFLDALLSSLN